MQTFTPQFSAALADHKAFIDVQAPLLAGSLASANEIERRAVADAANLPTTRSVQEEAIVAGLSQQTTLQTAQSNISPVNVRSSGASIGGLTDNVRKKSFSSADPTSRDIEREARRVKSLLDNTNNLRSKYELAAARAYAVGRLKTALMLHEAGQTGNARRNIEDSAALATMRREWSGVW